MRIEYDKKVDAAYIYLKDKIVPGEIKKTITLNENIIVDLDKENRLIGMEILQAKTTIPEKTFKAISSKKRVPIASVA